MIKVFNVNVYGIREALIRAGYPMTDVVNQDMKDDPRTVEDMLRLGHTLGNTPHAHGDDKFLRQIFVSFDVLATRYWWTEFDTYGFTVKDSQSTMHKIKTMPFDKMADPHVDPRVLAIFKDKVAAYTENPTEENMLAMKANMPEGIAIAAGIATNYAQLKTMFYQRCTHRLPEWREFCEWIGTLPYAAELGVVK